jgi:hypothetical protein
MTDRELMQQALDALDSDNPDIQLRAATALRARLAQPEQEPVACPYCHYSHTLGAVFFDQNCAGCVNRMTTPPQRECADSVHDRREWQGLTDEEMQLIAFSRAIEAKLKENNT